MGCSLESPCSGELQEDLRFRRDAELYGVRVRRFCCPAGHSHYTRDEPPPTGPWRRAAAHGSERRRYGSKQEPVDA